LIPVNDGRPPAWLDGSWFHKLIGRGGQDERSGRR